MMSFWTTVIGMIGAVVVVYWLLAKSQNVGSIAGSFVTNYSKIAQTFQAGPGNG